MKHTGINLDALLTLSECAAWMRISERELSLKARIGQVPAIRISAKILRFHPRTILDRFAKQSH